MGAPGVGWCIRSETLTSSAGFQSTAVSGFVAVLAIAEAVSGCGRLRLVAGFAAVVQG